MIIGSNVQFDMFDFIGGSILRGMLDAASILKE